MRRRGFMLAAIAACALVAALLVRRRRPLAEQPRADRVSDLADRRARFGDPIAAPQASGRVIGFVRDPDGRGVPHAVVVVVSATPGTTARSLTPLRLSSADPGGAFAFGDLPASEYVVAASAPGFLPASVAVALTGQREDRVVAVTLEAGGFQISGHVLDGSGGPIAGAQVSRVPSGFDGDEYALHTTVSGDDGSYRLSLPPGEHHLVFRRDGYADGDLEVRASRDQQIDVRLSAGLRLAGRVVDRASGDPVARAAVTIRQVRGFQDLGRAESDEEGRFSMTGLTSGTYELVARKGSLAGSIDQPLTLLPPGERSVSIQVDEGATIAGRVTRPSGKPLPGARLALGRWDHKTMRGEPAGAADADGRFLIRGALPEHTSVIAFGEGHAWGSRRIHVLGGDRLGGIDIVVPETRPLVVTVTAQGAPVSGARVSAWSARGGDGWMADARTRADGTAALPGVPVEKVAIWARDDHGEARTMVDVTEQPATTVSVALQPVPRISLDGHVTWLDGRPAPGATVFVFCSGPNWAHTRADARGAYRFADCQPGPLSVQAFRGDADLDDWRRAYLSSEQPPLTLDEQTRTVDLAVAAGGKRIVGRLLLPDGRPATDLLVTASADLEERTALTGPEGEFAFDDLTRQRHVLRVKAAPYPALERETTEADSLALVLRLRAGQRLSGTVTGPDGRPRAYARVLARSPALSGETYSGARGAFVLQGLVPGTYEIYVRGDAGFDVKATSLVLEPGIDKTIQLQADASAPSTPAGR